MVSLKVNWCNPIKPPHTIDSFPLWTCTLQALLIETCMRMALEFNTTNTNTISCPFAATLDSGRSTMEDGGFLIRQIVLRARFIGLDFSVPSSSRVHNSRKFWATVFFLVVCIFHALRVVQISRDISIHVETYSRVQSKIDTTLVAVSYVKDSIRWFCLHASLLMTSQFNWPDVDRLFQTIERRLLVGQGDKNLMKKFFFAGFVFSVASVIWLNFTYSIVKT